MNLQAARARLRKDVCRLARKDLPSLEYERFARFLERWLDALGGHQLQRFDPAAAYAEALSLLHHFDRSVAGKINLAVDAPSKAEISQIDIVLANIPFAVASLLNFFAAQSIYIQSQYNFIIFPRDGVRRRADNHAFVIMRFKTQPLAAAEVKACEVGIRKLLREIQTVTADWQPIKRQLAAAIAEYHKRVGKHSETEARQLDFLTWLVEDKCLFLGYAHTARTNQSALGLLRPNTISTELKDAYARLPPQPGIRFAKLPVRSLIHRPIYIEAITLGLANARGQITEHRFLLLYAYDLYNYALENVPYLAETFTSLMGHFDLIANSYRWRILRYALASYPRNELLRIAGSARLPNLLEPVMEAFSYSVLRSAYYYDADRLFAQVLVLMPRDDYDSQLRLVFTELLKDVFDTDDCAFDVLFSETQLVRIFFTLPLREDAQIDQRRLAQLEDELKRVGTSWKRQLRAALIETYGQQQGIGFFKAYADLFPRAYRDGRTAQQAARDLANILAVGRGESVLRVEFHVDDKRLRLFDRRQGHSLSRLVHLLENMGVEPVASQPYFLENGLEHPVRLIEFQLNYALGEGAFLPDRPALSRLFAENFSQVYLGQTEDDSFNRLTLLAGLSHAFIDLLRAWSGYLIQVQNHFAREHLENTLCAHPFAACLLQRMFVAKFARRARSKTAPGIYRGLTRSFTAYLEQVPSAEEDQILSYLRELISAINRTNFYTKQSTALGFKLAPRRLGCAEGWQPMHEIFVYDARFEGTQMRDGQLARGGIRWSQRRAGYRREVLGLVRAQVLKNSIIVPTGGKGGFFIKDAKLPAEEAYMQFIDALLQLTDNHVGGRVRHPPAMRIYDGADPYLVVAADKGTANFSDLANKVARQHKYWLDDAFASGGSEGYNHKEMGITARGAWESVCRHFAELGRDARRDPIQVIAVGDMSGDVFGNGMLLSKHIQLIAAFNHRHIFVDPEPDLNKSYAERKRLFNLPASSWDDYDASIISAGGGVFARDAKAIQLSEKARNRLGLKERKVKPDKLIQHILLARADLLWFGGIGTYVKASDESNRAIADRSNSALRVDGKQLRVRVVGEGANLGLTQAGRIEFAAAGGKVTTDSNDNSGGVHCSDREVNIKILMSQIRGMTGRKRATLLRAMTDEVADAVLTENHAQCLCLSLENARAQALLPCHKTLLHRLGDTQLNERVLTRPELAVLLSRCKTFLREHVAEQDTLKRPILVELLPHYYPQTLRPYVARRVKRIPFAKQVVEVQVVNLLVDHLGLAHWGNVDATRFDDLPRYAAHFLHLDALFGFTRLSRALASQPHHYPDLLPYLVRLHGTYARSLEYAYGLDHQLSYAETQRATAALADLVLKQKTELKSELERLNVTSEHSTGYVLADAALELVFVANLARRIKKPLTLVWQLFARLDAELHLSQYSRRLSTMHNRAEWERAALHQLADEFYVAADFLLRAMLSAKTGPTEAQAIFATWREQHKQLLHQYQTAITVHRLDRAAETRIGLFMQFLLGLLKKMQT